MTRLYMRLDIGFAVEDLDHVASLVKPWFRQQFVVRDDWEGHRYYLSYEPKQLPASGVCGVRIFHNRTTEGAVMWRLPHRQDLPTCAEVAVCGPDLLELGRVAARGRIACGDVFVIDRYVVGRSPADPTDPVLPPAHVVRFTSTGTPGPDHPTLMCQLAFGFGSADLATASTVAAQLMGTDPVNCPPRTSEASIFGSRRRPSMRWYGATRFHRFAGCIRDTKRMNGFLTPAGTLRICSSSESSP